MKICLATVHVNPRFTPLALFYLKACLVEQGGYEPDDVPVLEFDQDCQPEDIARRILATEPSVLGLSCYMWNVKTLTTVSRLIRQLQPEIGIVLGGPEVGPVAMSVLQAHPFIDVIVKGEGEIPFSELVAAWGDDGGGVECVKGICFRRGNEIVENEDAPVLQDLNRLPSPHLPQFGDPQGRTVCVETQRGCVFRCSYCRDASVVNRHFDLERVKQEVFLLLQQDVGRIYFLDAVFNRDAERARELCRFLIRHNHRGIKFSTSICAEFIDEELARLLREANFTLVEVGLQTTNTAALANVERKLRMEPFVRGIGYLKKFDLKFELQLIFGLPGDTLTSFRESLNFAISLDPNYLAVFPLVVVPGTELWRRAPVLNLDFDRAPPHLVRSHYSMNSIDIEYGYKMTNVLGELANSRTLRLLGRETGVTFAGVIEEWLAWQDGQPRSASPTDKVKQFVSFFCDKKQIPAQFYLGCAALEFRDWVA